MTPFQTELSSITFSCLQFTAETAYPLGIKNESSLGTLMKEMSLGAKGVLNPKDFLSYLDARVRWIKSHSDQITGRDRECLGVIYNTYQGHFPSSVESIKEIDQVFNKAKILDQLATKGAISFSEYTKQIPDLEYLLTIKRGREDQINKLIDTIYEGSWELIRSNYTLEMEVLPWDALAAFEMDKISSYQFTTILIFWSVFTQYSDCEIFYQRLFDEQGKTDREAKHSINQTVLKDPNRLSSFRSSVDIAEGVNCQTVGTFFELMKRQPKSECGFFYFKIPMPKARFHQMGLLNENGVDFRIEETRKISEVLLHKAEFNVFGYFVRNQETYMMVPTLTMMQQFLTANVGPENVVYISPHLGVSSEKEIMLNGENNTRDMGILFPGVALEETADNYCAPTALEYLKHDFYHAYVSSMIPKEFRHEYIRFSKCALEVEEEIENPFAKDFLHDYYLNLIDMDFGIFRTTRSDATFLKRIFVSFFELIQNLPMSTNKAIIKSLGSKVMDEKLYENLYNVERVKLMYILTQEKVAEKLAQKIEKKMGKNKFSTPLIWQFFFAELAAFKRYFKELKEYFNEEQIEVDGHKIHVLEVIESAENKKSLHLTEKFLRSY